MKKFFTFLFFTILQIAFLQSVSALKITEIMYNPDGSDTGREWVEIYNDGSSAIDFSTYKFFEANVNHGIKEISNKNIDAGEYAVVVQDEAKFKTDFPNFTGKIFTSSFSLSNTGESLSFKDSSGSVLDTINYTSETGSVNEGQSWQILNGQKYGAIPTPGAENILNTNTGNTTITNATTTSTTTTPTSTTSATTSVNTNTTNTIFVPIYSYPRDVIDPPKVYAYAGENKINLKNVEMEFNGKIFDGNRKEFRSGDFYWSFGDGTFSREKNVKKIFKNVGEYTVVLEVRWNDIVDTDKIYIKVIDPQVEIKIVDAKVEIFNNDGDELDLGNFILKREDNMMKTFYIPKNFSILPKRSIFFESEKTNFGEDISRVGIYYPNNTLLKIYPNNETIVNNASFINKISTSSNVSVMTLSEYNKSIMENVGLSNEGNLPKANFPQKKIFKKYIPKKVVLNNVNLNSATTSNFKSLLENKNEIILKNEKTFLQNIFSKFGF